MSHDRARGSRAGRVILAASLLCRSAPSHAVHGRLVLLDITTGAVRAQIELASALEPGNPRGGQRGFRGVVQDPASGLIYVADFRGIRVLDTRLREVHRILHPALAHIHALALDAGCVWAVSTANDTLLAFDLVGWQLRGAWELDHAATPGGISARWTDAPARPVGAVGRSRFHLNAIDLCAGSVLTGGLRSGGILRISPDGATGRVGGVPGAHDLVALADQVVFLDTARRRICAVDPEGRPIYAVDLPRTFYTGGKRVLALLPNVARRGFLRGLARGAGPILHAGLSPAAVAQFDTGARAFVGHIPISDDPRWMVAGLCAIRIS